jgi:hypothetical protein
MGQVSLDVKKFFEKSCAEAAAGFPCFETPFENALAVTIPLSSRAEIGQK